MKSAAAHLNLDKAELLQVREPDWAGLQQRLLHVEALCTSALGFPLSSRAKYSCTRSGQ